MIGYDFDGVLCEAPHIPGDKFRPLTPEEREGRAPELIKHFLTAKPLLVPTEDFIVVSGRVDTPDFRAASEAWLEERYLRWTLIMMPPDLPRTTDSIAEFKRQKIIEMHITTFTDDNPTVVDYIKTRHPELNIIKYEHGPI